MVAFDVLRTVFVVSVETEEGARDGRKVFFCLEVPLISIVIDAYVAEDDAGGIAGELLPVGLFSDISELRVRVAGDLTL